jgi:hypothetical protein
MEIRGFLHSEKKVIVNIKHITIRVAKSNFSKPGDLLKKTEVHQEFFF